MRRIPLARPVQALAVLANFLCLSEGRTYGQPIITEFALPGTGAVNAASIFYGHSMTAGPDGNLWFTHLWRSKVVRMGTDGRFVEFGLTGSFPNGITVGPDGNLWLAESERFGRMSVKGELSEFTTPTGIGGSGIVAAPDGNLWFVQTVPPQGTGGDIPPKTAIGKITPGGTITEYALPYLTGATSIIVGPDGNLWCIPWYWPDGRELMRVSLQGIMSPIAVSQPLGRALSLTLGPDGNVWFTARDNTVGKVTPAGIVTKYGVPIPTRGLYTFDIVAGPDGNLWFTEYDDNRIGRVTPQGVITHFAVPTPDSGPAAIAVGPDGNIWFTESKANKIGRLALSGPASGKATVTVPTAASKAGLNGTFFHTDLWLMNRSFTSTTATTLMYRCSPGQNCGNAAQVLNLFPRQSVMLSDVVGQVFGAPDTFGAIEISWPTSTGPVSASSRISTPLPPAPAFGAMIPALPQTAAKTRALFLGLASGGSLQAGSRSNAGAYNPNEMPADVTFTLRNGDGLLLGMLTRTYRPFEAYQLSPNVFDLLGVGSTATTDAYLVVTATLPVFPYVTVVDNVSGDSSFLFASEDEAAPEPGP